MQKARLAVHRLSACSGVKALRNTSDARRRAAKLCYRFGPLTPSARSANLIAGDGTKNGLSRSEQRTATNQKPLLDTKSPIQVRIQLPPAASPVRTRSVAREVIDCLQKPVYPAARRSRLAGAGSDTGKGRLVFRNGTAAGRL